jgi:hypothetical protein
LNAGPNPAQREKTGRFKIVPYVMHGSAGKVRDNPAERVFSLALKWLFCPIFLDGNPSRDF